MNLKRSTCMSIAQHGLSKTNTQRESRLAVKSKGSPMAAKATSQSTRRNNQSRQMRSFKKIPNLTNRT